MKSEFFEREVLTTPWIGPPFNEMLTISTILHQASSSAIQAFEVPIDDEPKRSYSAREIVHFAVRHYQLIARWNLSLRNLAKVCYSLVGLQDKMDRLNSGTSISLVRGNITRTNEARLTPQKRNISVEDGAPRRAPYNTRSRSS